MDSRLKILETLYRFDLDELSHIRLIQEAASRYWEKRRPVMLLSARCSSNNQATWSPVHLTRADWGDRVAAAVEVLPRIPASEMHQYTLAHDFYGGCAEAEIAGTLDNRVTVQLAKQQGINDVHGFCCGTREGGMVGLVSLCDSVTSTSERERAHWRPLAAHLTAAWRLRQRLELGATVQELTDAAFLPDGRCVGEFHGHLRASSHEQLRRFVQVREAERGDRTTITGIWTELAAGRWTLIDHFEADGRRLILALRNTPTGESLCRLTTRESKALTLARNGASNKEIGLSMDISVSGVTRLLQTAAGRLNAALGDILQFFPADTVGCRAMSFGESPLLLLSQVALNDWQAILSDAEKGIVAAVLRGLSNREIAAVRGRSVRTVVNQLASAFEKLGVRSRRELINRVAGIPLTGAADRRMSE